MRPMADHRTMAMNQNSESRFFCFLSGDELRNEIAIRPIPHHSNFVEGGN
jgi:hypothetical protein